MACETLGGVLLTEETDRQEKEQGGCSVEMSGRVDMRRLISLKEVKTMDGEPLREIAALMKTSVLDKPVRSNSSYLLSSFHSPPQLLVTCSTLLLCLTKTSIQNCLKEQFMIQHRLQNLLPSWKVRVFISSEKWLTYSDFNITV